MMMQTEKPSPSLSDEQVHDLWLQALPRLRKNSRPRRQRRMLFAGLAAAALGVLALGRALMHDEQVPAWRLSQGEGMQGPTMVTFSDESVAQLGERALVRVERDEVQEVRVAVTGGRARFSVTKNPARAFHVLIRGVDVSVVGTRFLVEDLGEGVSVSVEEGIVEVRAGNELRRLSAGQSWRGNAISSTLVEPAPEADAELTELDISDVPLAKTRPASKKIPAREVKKSLLTPPAPPLKISRSTADELFSAGIEARRTGQASTAKAAWNRFLVEYPGDARAGLASFELGRIEMDINHNFSASLRAIQMALELAPEAAFAEDALARLVQLQDSHKNTAACKVAKARYVSRYPRGTYAMSLVSLCQP
jgi:TolA-binding protein